MSSLTTDNRDLAEIENELRARIEAQRLAIETARAENLRLMDENQRLREIVAASTEGRQEHGWALAVG